MSLPDGIYHYTSAEGLHGILSSGILYFTDSLFLNDRNERKNFYLLLEDYLKKWDGEGRFKEQLQNRYFGEPNDILRNLTATNPADKKAARYFVLSCSTERDSLPMWNYYTHSIHAAGYNIHFKTDELVRQLQEHPLIDKITGRNKLLWGKILYNQKEKEKDLAKCLSRYWKKWSSLSSQEKRQQMMGEMDLSFELMSLFYKEPAFSHEKEVRIVIPTNNEKVHNIPEEQGEKQYQFRKVRGMQVPFLALNVVEKGKVITGVTAGPALDHELTVNGVEYMLYYYGFPQTCKVSAVPLRY